MIAAIRSFFADQGFLEVQTPLLTRAPAPESSIDAFPVSRSGDTSDLYLVPSPELHLKRLLAEGFEKIFQLGPVFRRGERGTHHVPEFTLVEWYRTGADYHKLMSDCEAMLRQAASAAGWDHDEIRYQGRTISLAPPFPRITVNDAFQMFAGWHPGPEPDPDRFDKDMVEKVEPALPQDRACFLMDFPASCASMAKLKPSDRSVSERVELYAGELELANGFSELTDPVEQAERFRREQSRRRGLGLPIYPWPGSFMNALEKCPESAGMAMGIDRLVMLLTDAAAIDQVLTFTPEES